MAFHPWSLPLFAVIALLSVLFVWYSTRSGRTVHRIATALMAVAGTVLTLFVWWIGQGEENSYANELYLISLGVLLAVTALVSVPAAWVARRGARVASH